MREKAGMNKQTQEWVEDIQRHLYIIRGSRTDSLCLGRRVVHLRDPRQALMTALH